MTDRLFASPHSRTARISSVIPSERSQPCHPERAQTIKDFEVVEGDDTRTCAESSSWPVHLTPLPSGLAHLSRQPGDSYHE
jgi:hypothetical protein